MPLGRTATRPTSLPEDPVPKVIMELVVLTMTSFEAGIGEDEES